MWIKETTYALVKGLEITGSLLLLFGFLFPWNTTEAMEKLYNYRKDRQSEKNDNTVRDVQPVKEITQVQNIWMNRWAFAYMVAGFATRDFLNVKCKVTVDVLLMTILFVFVLGCIAYLISENVSRKWYKSISEESTKKNAQNIEINDNEYYTDEEMLNDYRKISEDTTLRLSSTTKLFMVAALVISAVIFIDIIWKKWFVVLSAVIPLILLTFCIKEYFGRDEINREIKEKNKALKKRRLNKLMELLKRQDMGFDKKDYIQSKIDRFSREKDSVDYTKDIKNARWALIFLIVIGSILVVKSTGAFKVNPQAALCILAGVIVILLTGMYMLSVPYEYFKNQNKRLYESLLSDLECIKGTVKENKDIHID